MKKSNIALALTAVCPIIAISITSSAMAAQTTGITAMNVRSGGAHAIDYRNAQAMPLPMVNWIPEQDQAVINEPVEKSGGAKSFAGATGDGTESPVVLVPESELNTNPLDSTDEPMTEKEFGTSNHPFTTSRVDITADNTVSKLYPYSAAGKLFFKKSDGSNWVCSASLIKKGLVVTAAHCVSKFGANQFYNSFVFVPAYYKGVAPFGVWTGKSARVMTSYLNGTDSCYYSGVACKNDVAVITLNAQYSAYPGTSTGYFGYGWNGFGFTNNSSTLVNQLGYPVSHDAGLMMQRTDSQGYINYTISNNTIWGSRQTGGSSGGPELVNLGQAPVLSDSIGYGAASNWNVVIGVTSWGYTDNGALKQQGASPFLSSNIGQLVTDECANYNPACL